MTHHNRRMSFVTSIVLASSLSILAPVSFASERAKMDAETNRARLYRTVGAAYVRSYQYPAALKQFQSALSLAVRLKDVAGQAHDLCSMGGVYQAIGSYNLAIRCDQSAEALAEKCRALDVEAAAFRGLGMVHYNLGLSNIALNYLGQALAEYQSVGNRDREADVLLVTGYVNDTLSRFSDSERLYKRALALGLLVHDEDIVARALGSLGHVSDHLGLYDQALAYYRQALPLDNGVGDIFERGRNLCNEGVVYRKLHQYALALNYFHQSLVQVRQIDDVKEEEVDLANIGIVYEKLDQYVDGMKYINQALSIDRQIGDVRSEDEDIGNLGSVYEKLGEFDRAANEYQQALLVELRINDLTWEADTYQNLMVIETLRRAPKLAIYYGKQSVNDYQTIRTGVATLGPKAQAAYLTTGESSYHDLAELLIGQGRLSEAEHVLSLLKEQEFFQYLHPGANSQSLDKQLVPLRYTVREQRWITATAAAAKALPAVNVRITPLLYEREPSPSDKAQLSQWQQQLNASEEKYRNVLLAAATDLSGATDYQDVLSDTALSDDIARRLSPGMALVYTIVGDACITEIVVTPTATVARQSPPETSTDLYKDVTDFRVALTHPEIDPTPLGRKFYNMIVAPIKADLDAAGVKTILFSLDDALRYIPTAALVDPSGDYVLKTYKTETVSLIGGQLDNTSVSESPEVLGLGTSAAQSVGGDQFPALPGVVEELSDIVREPNETTGVLPGVRLLDADFTLPALEENLATRKYNIVHVASHFAIGETDVASYLLLGDGTGESVADLRSVPDRFAGVDLLTLSACDTNEDLQTHDGHEINSFGALMQQMGARSVIASLWPVSDAVTPALMQALYQYREQNRSATVAEALRYAQLTLLTGSPQTASSLARRGPTRDITPIPNLSNPDLPPFTPDPKAPYAHPYYWAPFVLIGDWR